ncbi:helix-turn-helix domain-containing protein [Nonomuraea helvata]|uniref:Helix-turn-helix domain-containing protein n=1 Tax=Nonomuraea helvata TaxID=37484 RepID=A0ABV5RY43_9ACTN
MAEARGPRPASSIATREPIAAVARRCGFASAESFRQAFVAWVGISPSRFRSSRTGREPDPEAPSTVPR